MTRTVAAILLLLLSAVALWAGQPEQGQVKPAPAAEVQQRVAEARDFLVDLLWMNTEQHWHSGRWEDCIRLCRQIIQLDRHFIEAYTGSAWMLWSMDRDDEAIEMYRAGVEANPDSHEIYHEFGMYYWHEHDWNEAAKQFRKSVELGAPVYFQHMLPNALERAGRKQEALEEWRALLKRFPDDPIAKRHIEDLEKQLEEEEEPGKVSPAVLWSGRFATG